MTTYAVNELTDDLESFDELTSFERIRSQRESVMPVSSARSAARGRRRSRPSKRRHSTPQHCSSISNRYMHRWK